MGETFIYFSITAIKTIIGRNKNLIEDYFDFFMDKKIFKKMNISQNY